MFLLIIQIFFRIISQKQTFQLTHGIHPKDLTRCESLSGNRYTNNNYNQYLINCEVAGTTFGFYGTTFSGHSTQTGSNMLQIVNVNFDVHNCPFTNCSFLSAMIYCHGNEYTFSMQRNTVKQCNNKINPISNANIVDCNCQKTTITDNIVTFSDTDNSCRAFLLENSRNTVFRNNQVLNANVGSENSGSALFITKSGTGQPIEFSKCKFTSCLGGRGSVLSLNELDYSIEISETTIERTKNEQNNGFGYLTQLNYNNEHSNPEAKFVECRFLYLESYAKGGGSIGLWFFGEKLNMSLIFERSTFESLCYHGPGNGGAVTIISDAANKDTHLTVSGGIFTNCTSHSSGAAICYCAPSQQLTITAAKFKDTRCTTQGGLGGSIFIELNGQTTPVFIEGCTFENATAEECMGNAVVLMERGGSGAYHYATIENCVFTDCGSSGYVVYYTIFFVMCTTTKVVFTTDSKRCGGIHKDIYNPSQKILNVPLKSGKMIGNGFGLKIEDSLFSGICGGAVNLLDCGLSCKNSQFKKCLSKSGGCGAIYVKSDMDLQCEAALENVVVDGCSAGVFGVVYLHNNAVSIQKCNFSNNEGLFGQTDSKSFQRGSAVYLAVIKGSVNDCTFSENKGEGGSLLINNNFDHNSPYLEVNSVEIDRCTFKIQKNSKCSLFYVGGNGKSHFVVKNCMFTGELASNAHYIDGQSLVKEAPKLVVKSCKFSYDSMSSLNLDPNNEFLAVDLSNQFFNYDESKGGENSTWKIIVAIVVPAAAVIVVIVVVTVIIKKKYENRNSLGDAEIADDSHKNDMNELKQTLI